MDKAYKCHLLTNSHEELEFFLYKNMKWHPKNGKEWAFYEDVDLSVYVVHFNEMINSLAFAKRGKKYAHVNQITNFWYDKYRNIFYKFN